MKKFVAVAVAAGLLVGGVAFAADKPTIGVVDMRKVLMESKAGKRNEAEFEKLVSQKKAALQGEEQKLQKMEQDIQKQQMVLTDKQKADKQKEYDGKAASYRKMLADAQELVGKKQKELMGKSVVEIRTIITDIAKQQGLQVVIDAPQQSVLYAQSGVDLTDEVIQKYDAKAGK
jgi:outer membrane protein